MKIYIIHCDVDYEMDYVESVHATREAAETALALLLSTPTGLTVTVSPLPNPDYYSIQEFEVQS